MPRIDQVISQADVLVLCRARYDQHIAKLIALGKRRGCPILYDVDDLVFDIERVHLLVSTIGADPKSTRSWDYWFGYVGRVSATIALCDRVIVTTAPLAKHVQSCFNKPVAVVPNFMNEQQLEISERIYDAKNAKDFRHDGTIHLGYFSGTLTHNHDYELISSALKDILERHPHTRLRVVGFLNVPDDLLKFSKRIELLPLQDFINLQRTIGSTDINLVPLQNNVFTNCKSGLKYFEAGIVGTVTIASPTIPFQNAIEHGTNGLLARPSEWVEMIEMVLADRTRYCLLARQARLAAKTYHTWEHQSSAIMTALGLERAEAHPIERSVAAATLVG
jgi:glycosyltransferase involved in cell wall biosynthesis